MPARDATRPGAWKALSKYGRDPCKSMNPGVLGVADGTDGTLRAAVAPICRFLEALVSGGPVVRRWARRVADRGRAGLVIAGRLSCVNFALVLAGGSAAWRGCGAAGSAPHWQCGGQGFESPQLHPFSKGLEALGPPPGNRVAATLVASWRKANVSTPCPRRSRDGP